MKCVYMWVNETTNKPFYVGCGTHTRAKSTKKGSRTKSFFEVYNNNKCHCEILNDNLTDKDATIIERETIKLFRQMGYDLVNITSGGEMRQYGSWTDEMRKEYSIRMTGKNNPRFGCHHTEETKKRLSKTRIDKGVAKGSKNPRATPVMCVETGEIFKCKMDATEFLGVKYACSSICACIRNPKRTVGKGRYHFVPENMFETLDTKEKRKEWLENIMS